MKNVHIRASIPENMRTEFQRIAKKNAQVPSILIRNWIENYIKEDKEELKNDIQTS